MNKFFEEEATRLLDEAEEFVYKHRGKTVSQLITDEMNEWLNYHQELSFYADEHGDEVSEQTRKRYQYLLDNGIKEKIVDSLISEEKVTQKLNVVRNMTPEELRAYYDSFSDEK